MNKTAIKNFAVWARNKLISEITYKASLVGISEKGILEPLSTSTDNIQFFDIGTGKPTEIMNEEVKQRSALVSRIKEKESTSDYKTAFQFVMEEVAYTWFNRLVAIRFMEVNEYLPSKIRVLSSEMSGKAEPDMVTTPYDTDMEFTAYETDRIMQLKDENKLDELFRMLFIKQCNKLNEVLPELFEKTSDYTEYLLNISFTDKDGVVSHLVNDIEEKDFTEAVEIIGWLYQYYNTELNAVVYDGNMSKSRITKELLPAATTMYTPDWAIKYMVENSLGRIAVDKFGVDPVSMGWKYYIEEVEQTQEVQNKLKIINSEKIKLEELKLIDPCMGSGHILVYAFDLLMQIYESQGYTQRDAVQSIIENNIYGLDIDERAYQLAYFAIIMKARSYDKRFLGRNIVPNLYYPKNDEYKEYGSILKINKLSDKPQEPEELTLFSLGFDDKLNDWNFERLIYQQYDVVITNPPYLGNSRFSPKLDKYVKDNYPDVKSDLSMVMLRKAVDDMCKPNGFVSFITTTSWMFLSSFERLRKHLLSTCYFSSLVDFGTELFDGKVGHNPIVAWVNRKSHINTKFTGVRLVDYCYSRRDEKELEFFNSRNHYTATQENFSKISGSPIAYWVSDNFVKSFEIGNPIKDIGKPRVGLQTGDNLRFLRYWFECNTETLYLNCSTYLDSIKSDKKWYPHNKGGSYCRWYGNQEYVVDYQFNGNALSAFAGASTIPNDIVFKDAITYSRLGSGQISFRIQQKGFVFDSAAVDIFVDHKIQLYVLALLNTLVTQKAVRILAPTLNTQPGDIGKLPVIINEIKKEQVEILAQQNITLSKTDWDSFETSWDFKKHPLI